MTTEIRHSGWVAEDEKVHTDYPRNDPTPWKENWGFLGVDKDEDVVVIFHVSLERDKNRARFSRFHNIRGDKYREQTYLEIDENFSTLEHGRIKIEFVEPLEKIRITDKGDDYELDVTFSARFDAYDYASHRKNRKPTGTNKAMNIRHYEQPLLLKGRYTKDGEVLEFDGYGYRDHSWGHRSDAEMDGHNWIWAHFPDCLIHISQMRLNDRSLTAGYIATKEGAIRAKEFETLELTPMRMVHLMLPVTGSRTSTENSIRCQQKACLQCICPGQTQRALSVSLVSNTC